MKTATKNEFSEQTIVSLVERYFPGQSITNIQSLDGGSFNTLYLIEGTGELQKGVILKTGPRDGVDITDHEKDNIRTEVKTYQLMEDRKIPVPKVYAYDFSREILPCDYFFMERMPGKTWFEHWPIRDNGLMYALGKYTARIHEVTANHYGSIIDDGVNHFDTWGDAFISMIEQAVSECQAQRLPLAYDELRDAAYSRKDILDQLEKPSLVNFDLWAGNIFVIKEEDGFYLKGIIDFERSFFGDPFASFASAFLLYDRVEKQKAFCRGYKKVTGKTLVITDTDQEKIELYRILMYLRGYSETHRYGGAFRFIQRTAIRYFIGHFLKNLKRMEKKRSKK